MAISIYYQNVNGLRTKTDTSLINSSILGHDVICLTETYLNSSVTDSEFFCSDYTVFRRDRCLSQSRKSDGGGVLIAVRSTLQATMVSTFDSDAEDMWVSVECAVGRIYVCCVYLPPGDMESFLTFLQSISMLRDNYPENLFVIVGDFNLPSIVWHRSDDGNLEPSEGSDLRSREFLDTYRYCNLLQFNHITNENDKVLDLVFSNFPCIHDVQSCSDSLVGLDRHHPAIEFLVNRALPRELRDDPTLIYFFNRADYAAINAELLNINWPDKFANRNIDDAVCVFYNVIYGLINVYVPHQPVPRRRYPIWYSASTVRTIREKLRFHRRWKVYGDRGDYLTFTILRKRTKTLIKSDYVSYVKSIQSQLIESPNRLWSFVRHRRGGCTGIPVAMKFQDEYANNTKDICSLFAQYFNSVFNDDTNADPLCLVSGKGMEPWFDENDVLRGLNEVNPRAGAGPDKLPGYFIKYCATSLAKPLFLIFSASLRSGSFPREWRRGFVLPVFKSGDRSDVSHYRPISILSLTSKVFEKIIYSKLLYVLKPHLIVEQHGFLPGRSVETNLITYTNFIHNAFNGSNQVDAIYTDFSKAFDRIDHNILMRKLSQFEIPQGLLAWLGSYITDRFQAVRVGNFVNAFHRVSSGVPQGSHLGPILFLAYINDITVCFEHSRFLLYADDCKIFLDLNCNSDCSNLQSDLDRFHKYCTDNSLFLNYNKCSKITFSRSRYPLNFSYILGGTALQSVDRICDLGVMFDCKLSFNLHVDYIIPKALKRLGFIIRTCRSFTNINCIRVLYIAYVSSVLSYASTVWNPQYTVSINRIESVQHRFMRYVTHKIYLPYCDYGLRCRVLDFQTLQQRRLACDLLFIYKLSNNFIDSSELVGELRFHVPPYRTRGDLVFRLNQSNTNAYFNSPIQRVLNSFNSHCGGIDIFNTPLSAFRRFLRGLGGKVSRR